MTTVKIGKERVLFFGKTKGSNSNKFHRATKLASMFNELDEKLYRFADRGETSYHARCALALRFMMHTGIRVGNEGSAEGYMTKPHPHSKKKPEFVQTYGLTTLTKDHVTFQRGKCYVNFLGKKQVENSFVIEGELSAQLRKLYDRPNIVNTLFDISDYELTKFIRKYVGSAFSPKDFRTMRANIEAYRALKLITSRELPSTKSELRAEVKEIAEHVSNCLSNTPGVCKKSYIDDLLWEYHEEKRWK